MIRRSAFFVLLTLTLPALPALAQQQSPFNSQPDHLAREQAAYAWNAGGPVPLETTWPLVLSEEGIRELLVVTLGKPNSRQHCRLPSFTADTMVCGPPSGRQTRFKRQDVVALIVPAIRRDRGLEAAMLGFLAGGGAVIYGAVALASVTIAGAIPVAVLGLFIAGVAGALGLGAQGDTAEQLFFLAPGTSLKLKLRQ